MPYKQLSIKREYNTPFSRSLVIGHLFKSQIITNERFLFILVLVFASLLI